MSNYFPVPENYSPDQGKSLGTIREYLNRILVDALFGYVGEAITIHTKNDIRNVVQPYVDQIIGGRDIRIAVEVEIEQGNVTISLVGDPPDISDFYRLLAEMAS